MTRAEAIKYLNEFIIFKKISNTTEDEAVECFKLAVDALEQQANTEQIIKDTIKEYIGEFYLDTDELLIDLNHDLCERIRKAK